MKEEVKEQTRMMIPLYCLFDQEILKRHCEELYYFVKVVEKTKTRTITLIYINFWNQLRLKWHISRRNIKELIGKKETPSSSVQLLNE